MFFKSPGTGRCVISLLEGHLSPLPLPSSPTISPGRTLSLQGTLHGSRHPVCAPKSPPRKEKDNFPGRVKWCALVHNCDTPLSPRKMKIQDARIERE